MRQIVLTLTAILCACAWPAAALADTALLNAAIADYDAQMYNSASDKLNRVEQSETKLSCADHTKVHYYLGLCNQRLNQIAAARQNYLWVSENGSDQRLRANAESALKNLDRWSLTRSYQGNGNVFRNNSPAGTVRTSYRSAAAGKT